MNINDYRTQLEKIYGNKDWILVSTVAAAMPGLTKQLHELGSNNMLCIVGAEGTGTLPDPTYTQTLIIPTTGEDTMGVIRAIQHATHNLDATSIALLDQFDPTKQARVIGPIFDEGNDVDGRKKFGARLKSWQNLEDKTTIDDLWIKLDINHAPHHIVDNRLKSLQDASKDLDEGNGTVWAADNKDGFNGAAQYVRWVRTPAQAITAHAFFSKHANKVRVMPFLEGIPCSIHAMVFKNKTIALRPCEMVVLRHKNDMTFQYASTATYWDPPTEQREAMRSMAKKVGDHLRDTLNYRGALTIDGVMTKNGFMPTELNPRYGAALFTLNGTVPKLPLLLINLAVVEDLDLLWHPEYIEQLLIENADKTRLANVHISSKKQTETPETIGIQWSSPDQCAIHHGEQPHATATIGPSPMGSFMRIAFEPKYTPVGQSIAPRVASAINLLNKHWSLGLKEVEAAKS